MKIASLLLNELTSGEKKNIIYVLKCFGENDEDGIDHRWLKRYRK